MSLDQFNRISIDILSDVVCPWCAIGYYRLLVAIQELGIEERVEIRWHPFELNPFMPEEGENLREHLAAKYGTTLNGSIEARKRLTLLGEELGFKFSYFDEMRMFNTRKAHLLLKWVDGLESVENSQTQLAEAFFKAYFSQGQDISDTEVLLDIVERLGFNRGAAQDVLDDNQAASELVEVERKWLLGGFRGVPVVIINGEEALQGAQEIETYKQVLEAVI